MAVSLIETGGRVLTSLAIGAMGLGDGQPPSGNSLNIIDERFHLCVDSPDYGGNFLGEVPVQNINKALSPPHTLVVSLGGGLSSSGELLSATEIAEEEIPALKPNEVYTVTIDAESGVIYSEDMVARARIRGSVEQAFTQLKRCRRFRSFLPMMIFR